MCGNNKYVRNRVIFLDWAIMAAIVAVISPVVVVIVTYSRAWAKVETTLSNLAKVIDKL